MIPIKVADYLVGRGARFEMRYLKKGDYHIGNLPDSNFAWLLIEVVFGVYAFQTELQRHP